MCGVLCDGVERGASRRGEVGATVLPRFLCGISFLFTKEIQMKRSKAEKLKGGLVAGRSDLYSEKWAQARKPNKVQEVIVIFWGQMRVLFFFSVK